MAELYEIDRKAEEHTARRKLLDPNEWHDPEAIGNDLLPVPNFPADLLPGALRDWAEDCAERMDRMAIDFPAIAIVTALGGLIGRRLAIHPKRNDPWLVVPNLWGGVVGRPSTKKTPALKEALRFIQMLETEAHNTYEAELAEFDASVEADKLHRKAMETELKKQAKTDKAATKKMLLEIGADESSAPTRIRHLVNDVTIEKLGELLKDNPSGVLLFRDELTGWLTSLDKEGREQDRAFFLESWNGTGSFTWDRIGRGTVHVPSVCLSVLGGIQPAKLTPYLKSMSSGSGDDGLLQRFQLLVWPDAGKPVHVDKTSNQEAWDKVHDLFIRLSTIPSFDGDDNQPIIRFDHDAQTIFDSWYSGMLTKEHDESNPFIESHLTKYHSLMPSLALIFHLVEGEGECVGDIAATRAIAWCDYLEAHARRIYGLAGDSYYGATKLLGKLNKLPNPFQKSDFNNLGWSGLTNAADINFALKTLERKNVIKALVVDTATKPATLYFINPHLTKLEV